MAPVATEAIAVHELSKACARTAAMDAVQPKLLGANP